MNVFTHLAIAMKIKHAIEDMLPVKLKTFDFLLGSIKPDISPSFSNIPHYKKKSLEFVTEEIEELLLTEYAIFMEHTNIFSERLGILTHYLSDFFCYAHSEKFNGGIIKHSLYEMKLMAYCSIKFKHVFCPQDYRSVNPIQNKIEICNFIEILHCEYSDASRKPSVVDDMTFTHEACIAICVSILSSFVTEAHISKLKLAESLI